jgi:colanic acid biosynthesis glycosyl transferase WcaI
MRILVVTLMYLPDAGPSAPLFAMLCEGLARRGHEVTVIAAVPHYPTGQVPPGYRGRWVQPSRENDVKVVRVLVPSVRRANLALRLLQFLCFQVGATLAGLRKPYDVCLFSNPALEVWLPFACLSGWRAKPAIFSVHDVYPEVGVTLGIFRHRAVIAAVAFLERFCLRGSAYVRVLSQAFRQPLKRLGVPDEKIALIYDWVDTDLIKPRPRDNSFSREHRLNDKFVVLYAGNIGFSQGLDHVLAAAALLKNDQEIRFVLVGGGAGLDHLKAQAVKMSNVEFLPFQPRARLPEVLATADVSLVTLRRGIGTASLPSKTFSILASGRPLLASVDEDSETWKLVARSGAGVCVPPEDPPALARAIVDLKKDPAWRARLGKNGRAYALRHHSPQAAAGEFERLLFMALNYHA